MSCGPSKYDKFIPDLHFECCCQLHDQAYDKIINLGKNLIQIRLSEKYDNSVNNFLYNSIIKKLEYHRQKADELFLTCMLKKNRTLKLNSFRLKIYDIIAYTYFYVVKKAGMNIITGAL